MCLKLVITSLRGENSTISISAGCLGVGKQECIFEAFGCFLGFIGGQPLLKQRRKGSLVDTLSGGEISDDNLPIAFERKFGQMMFTTCPGGEAEIARPDRSLAAYCFR